jgi:hypothetical protein
MDAKTPCNPELKPVSQLIVSSHLDEQTPVENPIQQRVISEVQQGPRLVSKKISKCSTSKRELVGLDIMEQDTSHQPILGTKSQRGPSPTSLTSVSSQDITTEGSQISHSPTLTQEDTDHSQQSHRDASSPHPPSLGLYQSPPERPTTTMNQDETNKT